MARPRGIYKQLELSGLTQKNKNKYALYNPSEGLPIQGIPLPPKGTSKKGKEFWNATIPALCQMGVLSYTDVAEMESLLNSYEALQISWKNLKKFDSEDRELTDQNINMRKKLMNIYVAASSNFTTLSSKFGMTPVDRTRLPIVEPQMEEKDPLEILGV